jgi:hypothetical protein
VQDGDEWGRAREREREEREGVLAANTLDGGRGPRDRIRGEGVGARAS